VRISLISDSADHPVLAEMVSALRARHRVGVLSTEGGDLAALEAREATRPSDLYLLKSHTPAALELARRMERRGAHVVNGWASTLACQDRVLMARRLVGAGLPSPRTWTLAALRGAGGLLPALPFPLIVKSRYSRRGDLVARVGDATELDALMEAWADEPVILQEYEDNDGWDVKLWVVGTHAYAARRSSPLGDVPKETIPLHAEDLSAAWVAATLRVGREFDLSLYGVDMLATAHGPVIVDVNAFPGYRGVPGAGAALAAFAEGLSTEESASA
jgi:ribosomal protein S6--L-glutamate ligase